MRLHRPVPHGISGQWCRTFPFEHRSACTERISDTAGLPNTKGHQWGCERNRSKGRQSRCVNKTRLRMRAILRKERRDNSNGLSTSAHQLLDRLAQRGSLLLRLGGSSKRAHSQVSSHSCMLRCARRTWHACTACRKHINTKRHRPTARTCAPVRGAVAPLRHEVEKRFAKLFVEYECTTRICARALDSRQEQADLFTRRLYRKWKDTIWVCIHHGLPQEGW